MKVGIIGGTGGMGKFFAGLFQREGWEVLISGRSTPLSSADLVHQSDLIIISVPIHETIRVIEEIQPYVRDDQILADFTSLKINPVQAMLKTRAEVIGLHPMFGPTVSDIAGQTIIATPARCSDTSFEILKSFFEKNGARITVTSPEEHDKMMAIIQGMTHFKALVLAGAMRRLGVSPQDTLEYTSPVYRIETSVAGRLLAQNPELYADILIMNPEVPHALEACMKAAGELFESITVGDKDKFIAEFKASKENFGSYCNQALDDTNQIIDSMVNR